MAFKHGMAYGIQKREKWKIFPTCKHISSITSQAKSGNLSHKFHFELKQKRGGGAWQWPDRPLHHRPAGTHQLEQACTRAPPARKSQPELEPSRARSSHCSPPTRTITTQAHACISPPAYTQQGDDRRKGGRKRRAHHFGVAGAPRTPFAVARLPAAAHHACRPCTLATQTPPLAAPPRRTLAGAPLP